MANARASDGGAAFGGIDPPFGGVATASVKRSPDDAAVVLGAWAGAESGSYWKAARA
jgi:hypothetical protein